MFTDKENDAVVKKHMRFTELENKTPNSKFSPLKYEE
jgi:hypothetical protein